MPIRCNELVLFRKTAVRPERGLVGRRTLRLPQIKAVLGSQASEQLCDQLLAQLNDLNNGIEIVFTRDADKGEKGVATRISQRRSHPMRGCGVADWADWPIGSDPFA